MNKVLADEIVAMHRDEGESSLRIVRILRARGIHATRNIVNEILRDAGLSTAKSIGRKRAEIHNLEALAARWAGGTGESLIALAKEAGVTGSTLGRRFQEAGYAREAAATRFRVGSTSIERLEYAAKLFEGGRSLKSIADELEVDPTLLANQLKDCGLIPDMDLRMRRGKQHPSARRRRPQ
jgi:AraC-like DNA-binding protein